MNAVDISQSYINSLKTVIGNLYFEQNMRDIKGLNILRAVSNAINFAGYYSISQTDVQSMIDLFFKVARANPDFKHPGEYIAPEDILPSDYVEPPITMTSAGVYGQIAFDDNFMYRCIKSGSDGNALWVRNPMSLDW